ncbi:SDR family NAD(P)-dependent oxidoreductase [Actinocorallia sp. A-T 12471]|uniref:SDR family NAD(P)-dependent oxidoreductase n=1 Tax=Actinocorallia sp. A-T 12471 TaxID=3089813 RepID=UPI0029CEBE57|nr:SDR family NAD(P)-dependent oxidoreductase [Actinocorallia sp. A-T 12471]MDX6740860.1 SDR family NAD(P)-dependent oxidoreductase [Actinocorallia sp. A-T 12471]
MTAVDYRGQLTVITGASAGLGVEFARQLARRGSDLVLVARRADRLRALADELARAHGVAVHPVAFDLARADAGEALAAVLAADGLTPTSLVNNAGFGSWGAFHLADPEKLRKEIALDVAAVADLSRAFLPGLRAAGRGVLINVASLAAYQGTPKMAAYGAAKAFVLSLSEALWVESRGTGLKVIALSPGTTRTEFFDVAGSEDAAGGQPLADPADVVATALRALDRRNPPPHVVAGLRNRLMTGAGRHLLTRATATRALARISGTSAGL